jgi:peroxiredoxin
MLTYGVRTPDFTLPDTQGVPHRLAAALGRGPVVLAFLKADCNTCRLAFPYLERLHQTYPPGAWSLWGICQHPARAAAWFAQGTGITFPLLIDDPDLAVSRAYDPPATPTIVLLDQAGAVRASHTGLSKRELNALAAQLAATLDQPAAVVAPPDDGTPDFRPG